MTEKLGDLIVASISCSSLSVLFIDDHREMPFYPKLLGGAKNIMKLHVLVFN